MAGKGIRITATSGEALQLKFEAMGGSVYSGDFGTTVSPSEDKFVGVIGEAANSADLTNKNIGVISSKDAAGNAVLVVKLNKDLSLDQDGSITIGEGENGYVRLTSKDLSIGKTVVSSNNIRLGTSVSLDSSTGLTIKRENSPSGDVKIRANEISAGGLQINNVADGEISQTSSQAVNGSQLYTVYRTLEWSADVSENGGVVRSPISEQRISAETANSGKVSFRAGAGIIISTDNNGVFGMTFGVNKKAEATVTDGRFAVVEPSDVYWDARQIAEAVNSTYWTAKDGIGNSANVQPGQDLTISGDGGVRVTLNGNSRQMIIGLEGISTVDSGLKFMGDSGNTAMVKLNDTLNVTGGVTDENKLSEGNIGVVSSQAGANGQLVVKLSKNIDLGSDGSIKVGSTDISSGQVKAGDSLFNTEGLFVGDTSVTDGQVKTGDTTMTAEGVQVGEKVTLGGSGLVIAEGPSVTNDGINAGSMKITNVANGEVSENSTEAVNGSQLWTAMQEAGGSWYLAAGENADTEKEEIAKNNTVKFIVGKQPEGSKNLFIERSEKTVKFTIKENPSFAGIVKATGGFDASGKKVRNVAAGDVSSNSTDAINGSQLHNTANSVAKSLGGGAKVDKNGKVIGFKVTMKADAGNTSGTPKNYENVAAALSATDTTVYKMTQHFTTKKLTVEGDASVGGSFTAKGPALFESDVTMKKSLKVGNITINENGSNKISNLAPGTNDSDAVNLGQLKSVAARNESMYSELDRGIRRTGARAAALAGLHPLPYDEDAPTTFTAAVGNYRGETSVALGVMHHFDRDTLLSVGGTVGDEPMLTAGLSLRLGRYDEQVIEARKRKRRATAEKNRLIGQISTQAVQIEKQKEELEMLKQRLNVMEKKFSIKQH